ncbi:MAG: amidase domain-containing protein [Turicibacter sp.]
MGMNEYNRKEAVSYAKKWALGRNRQFHDYENYGGDCTNFISQCIFSGGIPFDSVGSDMVKKWYWYSDSVRTPSWTSATSFRRYLLSNNVQDTHNFGIYAKSSSFYEVELGDLVQKKVDGVITHTMIITGIIFNENDEITDYLLCQHSDDYLDIPLSQKDGELSFIKIMGYYN